MTKTCTKCGETKPEEEFPLKNGKREARCKECRNRYYREIYYANPERRANIIRLVAARKIERGERALRYGLTKEQLAELIARHDGLCWLCLKRQGMCVDHDHETGRVRGILCVGCNSALGTLGDSVKALERVVQYLK